MPLVISLVPVEFKDVIKQISSAEFGRHKALKVEKVKVQAKIRFSFLKRNQMVKVHPISIFAIRCTRRQETVSMLKYSP